MIKFPKETRNGTQYLFTSPQQQMWHKSDASHEGKIQKLHIQPLLQWHKNNTKSPPFSEMERCCTRFTISKKQVHTLHCCCLLFCMKNKQKSDSRFTNNNKDKCQSYTIILKSVSNLYNLNVTLIFKKYIYIHSAIQGWEISSPTFC